MRSRRQSNSGEGLNLDSLMDALTNVVAVLILVLVLVQADVTKKVVQFLEDLVPVSPEELAVKEDELSKLQAKLTDRRKLAQEDPPRPEEIEAERRKSALLEKEKKDNTALLANLSELRKLTTSLEKDQAAQKKKTNSLQAEIAKLEAQLDETPVLKAPPPTEVTIPDSRPIPPKAEVYYALVYNQRVHLIDPHTPLERFQNEFMRRKHEWQVQRIKRQGKDRLIYDPTKIMNHYKEFDFEPRSGQTVLLQHNPTWTRIKLQVRTDPKAGITEEEILTGKGNSSFAKAMRSLSGDRNNVVMFWVHPNSFNTYLVARTVADWAGVPAGWQVRGDTAYTLNIPDLEVKRLKEPPPPDPNAPPPPKRPPRIEPKLD